MCKKDLEIKVQECGAAYGMDIYTERELLSLATGIDPEKFTGTLQEALDYPRGIKGIGKRKELVVFAIKELTKRLMRKNSEQIDIVHGPEDAAHFAMPYFRTESKEHFAIMMLNTKNHILGLQTISVGSLTASVVHPREVFEAAILHHSAAIILLHNHPSGDPTPSREDISVTQRLVKVGKMMDIPVLDHIILGSGNFESLKEKGIFD